MSKTEGGNIIFFLLIIVPLIFAISIAGFDFANYLRLRQEGQRVADSAVMSGLRLLPDMSAASGVVRDIVNREGYEVAHNQSGMELLSVSRSSIGLTLHYPYRPKFGVLLPGLRFNLLETASAQFVPRDHVVIVSDAVTLRPPAKHRWGNVGQWPSSKYFRLVANPRTENMGPEPVYWPNWSSEWESDTFRSWATQSCYNPVFSRIKSLAVNLVDVLGAGQKDRVGLIFSPGDFSNADFTVAREVSFPSAATQVIWSQHFEKESYFSDELCYYMGKYSVSNELRYILKEPAKNYGLALEREAECGELGSVGIWAKEHLPYGRLKDCYLSEMGPRDAIYFRAARPYPHRDDASNISHAIKHAYAEILSKRSSVEAQKSRGNYAPLATATITVISDALPVATDPSLVDLISSSEVTRIKLRLVGVKHQGLTKGQRTALDQVAHSYSQLGSVDVFIASSPEMLAGLAPRLLATGREVALNR